MWHPTWGCAALLGILLATVLAQLQYSFRTVPIVDARMHLQYPTLVPRVNVVMHETYTCVMYFLCTFCTCDGLCDGAYDGTCDGACYDVTCDGACDRLYI